MRKILVSLMVIVCLGFNTPSSAADGTGKIEEIKLCSYDSSAVKKLMLFRLTDGNWFGVYGYVFHSSIADSISNSPEQSMLLMAYASRHTVNVRANYVTTTNCGVTASLIWNTVGDYIHIVQP